MSGRWWLFVLAPSGTGIGVERGPRDSKTSLGGIEVMVTSKVFLGTFGKRGNVFSGASGERGEVSLGASSKWGKTIGRDLCGPSSLGDWSSSSPRLSIQHQTRPLILSYILLTALDSLFLWFLIFNDLCPCHMVKMVPITAQMPNTMVAMVWVGTPVLVARDIGLELAERLGNGGMICVEKRK